MSYLPDDDDDVLFFKSLPVTFVLLCKHYDFMLASALLMSLLFTQPALALSQRVFWFEYVCFVWLNPGTN